MRFRNATFFGRTDSYCGAQVRVYSRGYHGCLVEIPMTGGDSLTCDREENNDYVDNAVDKIHDTLTSRDILDISS